jgi:AbrB family looped-hinge helix DNA binding protein
MGRLKTDGENRDAVSGNLSDRISPMERLSRNSVFLNEVEVNARGQIVIPAKIRDLLGLEKNSRLQIKLNKSGTIELQKIVHIPVDFSLEFNTGVTERVKAAYAKMEKGQVGDSESLKSRLNGA